VIPPLTNLYTPSRSDLEAFVAMCERRLVALKADERKDGVDYSVLRQRIERDLKRAKERLRGV
jgi:hypothetical protein